jgi:hypothetical protein
MKKLLYTLLAVSIIFSACKKEDEEPTNNNNNNNNNSAPKTYVPDNGFEQRLIVRGYDDVLDDYVITANINTVSSLYFASNTVSDVTGIEDFTALTSLICSENQITNLDLRQNTNLTELNCYNNPLYTLDLRNGKSNYSGNMSVIVGTNHHLTCVSVDDVDWANQNLLANGSNVYYFYPEPTFSTNCN